MSTAAPDCAPESLAQGTAQPLRGELEALLGADRVLGRAGDEPHLRDRPQPSHRRAV